MAKIKDPAAPDQYPCIPDGAKLRHFFARDFRPGSFFNLDKFFNVFNQYRHFRMFGSAKLDIFQISADRSFFMKTFTVKPLLNRINFVIL
jgi:hypothetical protein